MTIVGLLLAGIILYVGYRILRLIINVFVDQNDLSVRRNSQHILDNYFDGSEKIVYRVRDHGTLTFDQVLLGAEQRGYRLYDRNQDSPTQNTLIFEKSA